MQCKTLLFEFHNMDEVAIASGLAKINFSTIAENITIADAKMNTRKVAQHAEIILKRNFYSGRFREKLDLECISIQTDTRCYRVYLDSDLNKDTKDNTNEHLWINDFGNICLAVGKYTEAELTALHEKMNFDYE